MESWDSKEFKEILKVAKIKHIIKALESIGFTGDKFGKYKKIIQGNICRVKFLKVNMKVEYKEDVKGSKWVCKHKQRIKYVRIESLIHYFNCFS